MCIIKYFDDSPQANWCIDFCLKVSLQVVLSQCFCDVLTGTPKTQGKLKAPPSHFPKYVFLCLCKYCKRFWGWGPKNLNTNPVWSVI